MIHWLCGLTKRLPARTMLTVSAALLCATLAHANLVDRLVTGDDQRITPGRVSVWLLGDAAGALAATVILAIGLWKWVRPGRRQVDYTVCKVEHSDTK